MKRRIGVVVLAAGLLMTMVGVVPASATPAPPPCEDVAGSYPCGQLSTFEVPVPTELCSQFSLEFCLPPAEDHLANATGALPGGATEPQLKTTSSSEGPAPAGEDLTVASAVYSKCTTACGDIDITITYALPWGGTFTSEPLSLPHASSQYAGFVISGNVVRWWNEETRTPYVFGYRFDATQEQAGVPVMAGGPVAPGSMYEREVQEETFAVSFQYPNGSAAANLEVLAAFGGEAAFAFARTDDNGLANLTIPVSTSPYLQQRALSPGYVPVIVSVFDSVPPNPVPAEGAMVSGYGIRFAGTINLASQWLPARDPNMERMYDLAQLEEWFFPYAEEGSGDDEGYTCRKQYTWGSGSSEYCVKEVPVNPPVKVEVPEGYWGWVCVVGVCTGSHHCFPQCFTVGGDHGWKGRFHFQAEEQVETGWYYRYKDGWGTDDWTVWGGGENTMKSTDVHFGSYTSPWWGGTSPPTNKGYILVWELWIKEQRVCTESDSGKYCQYKQELIPKHWTGQTLPADASESYHGQFDETMDIAWLEAPGTYLLSDGVGESLTSSTYNGGEMKAAGLVMETKMGWIDGRAANHSSGVEFTTILPGGVDHRYFYFVVHWGKSQPGAEAAGPAHAPARLWTLTTQDPIFL